MAFGGILWPIQANSGPGTQLPGDSWANAIDWVRTADSGGRRKVIILEVQTGSFGNYEMVPSVNAAIRTAIANGVVVCVAAGNGDRDAGIDDQGNAIPETGSILVGATAYSPAENRRAGFSNYGPRIVVCAPGDGAHDLTCSSSADNTYRNGFGGTSGATPKVAATAALMLEVNPNRTHAQIRAILNQSGSPVVTEAGKPVGTFLNSEAAISQPMAWTPNWASLGGVIFSDPTVASNADGRLEVFVRGTDNNLYHKWQTAANGAWTPNWASLSGVLDGNIGTGRNADGRLEVFVRGTDNNLYHKWQI
jgi:subtilisin family serine protease